MKGSVLKYRIVFSLLLSLVFYGSDAEVTPPDSLFKKGHEAYHAGQFAEAEKAYRQILNAGWNNAAVHYNLGNCYYKQGELGLALLHYEKARERKPGDKEIEHNLKLAQEKRIDRFEQLPQPIFKRAFQSFITLLSPSQWGWGAIGAAGLLLIGLALYFFSGWQRGGFSLALASLLLLGIAMGSAALHQNYRAKNKPALVMEPAVYVKSGPSSMAEDAFILHEGTKVYLSESYEEWVKLRLSDGKIGWAKKDSFSVI